MRTKDATGYFRWCGLAGLLLVACSTGATPSTSKDAGNGTGGGGGGTTGGGSGGTSLDAQTGDVARDRGVVDVAATDVVSTSETGGATTDASGTGDTGMTPRPPADCPAGALFCDDFEGYALGGNLSPNWTTTILGGAVNVETSKPFRGTKGVRITTTLSPANEPPRAATDGGPVRAASLVKEGAPLFPIAGNAFYGRMMMWLTQMPPGGVHFSNIEANGKLPDGTIAKYGEGGMFATLLAGYTIRPRTEVDVPTIDCGKASTTGLPEKRWVCVEWQFDGANDEMHYWFDGQLQGAVDIVKTGGGCPVPWRAPVFNKLFIGWRHSQPSPINVEMWLDNIVLHTSRIGCPVAP